MAAPATKLRIVILGKTGAGKSSLANTLLGENLFEINHGLSSETRECQAETRPVNGRMITLIDTPGFFDTDRSEGEIKTEILRCITECAPGPHAFLIVLKVEKFTEHEQAVIEKIKQYFSDEVLRYATVLFTHGDQLPEGRTIKDLVDENETMSDLVKDCGGRCHVIDNRYWNANTQHDYRNNQVQVRRLLESITEANNGGFYTNNVLTVVEEKIQEELNNIVQRLDNMAEDEIRVQARSNVFQQLLTIMQNIGKDALLGALFGIETSVRAVLSAFTGTARMVMGGAR